MTVVSAPTARSPSERWRTIFDGDLARVVVIGSFGEVLAVNPAWRARHGELLAGTPWTEHNCFDVLVSNGSAGSMAIARAISEILDGNRDAFEATWHLMDSDPLRNTIVRGYLWVHGSERRAVLRFEDAATT